MVATDPPTVHDMECAIDRKTFKNEPECFRASLSCARSAMHLDETRRAVPRLRQFVCAQADLGPAHGKIMKTRGPGHYSMWLRAKYLAIGHTLFRVPR